MNETVKIELRSRNNMDEIEYRPLGAKQWLPLPANLYPEMRERIRQRKAQEEKIRQELLN